MSTSDENPMLIRHGRAVWKDVVATRETAEEILEILAPETSPVLDSLVRIEAKLDILMAILLPPATGAREP